MYGRMYDASYIHPHNCQASFCSAAALRLASFNTCRSHRRDQHSCVMQRGLLFGSSIHASVASVSVVHGFPMCFEVCADESRYLCTQATINHAASTDVFSGYDLYSNLLEAVHCG